MVEAEIPTISIGRTTDVNLLKSIFGHESIRQFNADPNDIEIPIHDALFYLFAKEERFSDGSVEDSPIGAVVFSPVNPVTWTPHIAVLPEHRGKGTDVMRMAIDWIFTKTHCVKLFAAPPIFNKAMIRVFEKCEFKVEGFSPNSFLHDGQLYPRILMGLSKEMQ